MLKDGGKQISDEKGKAEKAGKIVRTEVMVIYENEDMDVVDVLTIPAEIREKMKRMKGERAKQRLLNGLFLKYCREVLGDKRAGYATTGYLTWATSQLVTFVDVRALRRNGDRGGWFGTAAVERDRQARLKRLQASGGEKGGAV